MKKIILYMACSIDGFIAKKNEDISWIDAEVNLGDFSFESFLAQVDTIFMGRKSYQQAMSLSSWSYNKQTTYVFSKAQIKQQSINTNIISDLNVNFVRSIQQEGGKDIWLFGGGNLNHFFLENNLIDELMLFVQPVVLGDGISIFGNQSSQLKEFQRKKVVELASDFTLLWYEKKQSRL